jgi:hypothetical protein
MCNRFGCPIGPKSFASELEDLDRQEQAERRHLEAALSLSRLDLNARGRRGLALPRPDQVRLLVDI